jgi:G protein beta subunit-like protein
VCVWDLGTAKLSTALRPEPDVPVQALSIAEDNSALAAATNSGTVYVWAPPGDSAGYTPVHQLQAHRSYILSLKLSPDGSHMATCSADKTVKLWDAVHDFAPSGTLTGHSSWAWDCAFTVDGQYLITGSSDKTARLWDVASCECVHTYTGHGLGVQAVALADEVSAPGESRAASMGAAQDD